MKVRAILEFDLENESGDPITERKEYVWAAEAADDAIRSRLMGAGFLADDTMIGTYTLDVTVIDGMDGGSTAAEPEPNQAPDSAVLSSNQFDNLLDDATHAVNDMIPDHVLADLSSDGRTDLLYAINDALTAVLDPYIERKP